MQINWTYVNGRTISYAYVMISFYSLKYKNPEVFEGFSPWTHIKTFYQNFWGLNAPHSHSMRL